MEPGVRVPRSARAGHEDLVRSHRLHVVVVETRGVGGQERRNGDADGDRTSQRVVPVGYTEALLVPAQVVAVGDDERDVGLGRVGPSRAVVPGRTLGHRRVRAVHREVGRVGARDQLLARGRDLADPGGLGMPGEAGGRVHRIVDERVAVDGRAWREGVEDPAHEGGLAHGLGLEGESPPGDDDVAEPVLSDLLEVPRAAQPGQQAEPLGRPELVEGPLVGLRPGLEVLLA